MKTSYFAKYKGDKGVNIAMRPMPGFKGPSYPLLYPKWSFLSQYKRSIASGGSIGEAERIYYLNYHSQILHYLNPQTVLNDLRDNVLLCWEKSGQFCHRRIVAEWIERHTSEKVDEI